MWIFGYGSLVWKADFPYVKKVVGYIKGYERKFYQASIDHRGVPEKPGRVVTLIPSDDPDYRVWGVVYKIHRRDVDFVIKHLDMREVMGYEKVPAEFFPIPQHPLNIFDNEAFSIPVSKLNSSEDDLKIFDGEGENDSDSGRGSYISDDVRSNNDTSESDTDSICSGDNHFDALYDRVREGHPFTAIMYFGDRTNEHFIGPSTISQMALEIYESSGASGTNREYLFNLAESMRAICPEAMDSHLLELELAVRSLEECLRRNACAEISL